MINSANNSRNIPLNMMPPTIESEKQNPIGSLNFDNFNMSKVYNNEHSSRYYAGNKSVRSFNFLRDENDNKPKDMDECQDTFDFLGTHGSY